MASWLHFIIITLSHLDLGLSHPLDGYQIDLFSCITEKACHIDDFCVMKTQQIKNRVITKHENGIMLSLFHYHSPCTVQGSDIYIRQ